MRAIVCYDFSCDKARSRFVKVLSKYGFRVQYSVFEFKLDKDTWKKLIEELQKKKFLNGNHNIIIIPITDSVHKKIVRLGDAFLCFDYSVLMYSAFGIKGLDKKGENNKIDIDKILKLADKDN